MRRLKVFWDRSNYERNKGKLFLNEMTVLFAFLQYQKSYLNCATHFFNFPPVSKSLLEVPQEQCDQIWQIGKFLTVYLLFFKVLSPLWQICDIIGLISIVANGQILKIIEPIWSHCRSYKDMKIKEVASLQ